jgi:NAD(P)-dependent dehydrogenase (short-subunit alcohol dehydrogenase family)
MKTVMITGGTSGLGLALARQLIFKKNRVIIAGRNTAKMDDVKKQLEAETGEELLSTIFLDLSSFESIRNAVVGLQQTPDALVCNAAVAYETAARFTIDGFEETFQVNYPGHFLLIHLMLKKYNASLRRIVMVASNAYDPAKTKGFFPSPHFSSFAEIAFEQLPHYTNTHKQGALRYVHSKLCGILFTYELHSRLNAEQGINAVKINAYHPGFIPTTGISRETSALYQFILKYIMPPMKLFFNEIVSADDAAERMLPLILYTPSSGKYFHGPDAIASSMLSYNEKLWHELWNKSVEWISLTKEETIFPL